MLFFFFTISSLFLQLFRFDLFMTCSHLIQHLFMTSSLHVHDFFMKCSQLFHSSFMNYFNTTPKLELLHFTTLLKYLSFNYFTCTSHFSNLTYYLELLSLKYFIWFYLNYLTKLLQLNYFIWTYYKLNFSTFTNWLDLTSHKVLYLSYHLNYFT